MSASSFLLTHLKYQQFSNYQSEKNNISLWLMTVSWKAPDFCVTLADFGGLPVVSRIVLVEEEENRYCDGRHATHEVVQSRPAERGRTHFAR